MFNKNRLLARAIDPDCGCLEEEWDTQAGYAFIHLLPSGTGECYFDNSDCGEWGITIEAGSVGEFRKKFIHYTENIPFIDA